MFVVRKKSAGVPDEHTASSFTIVEKPNKKFADICLLLADFLLDV
jgi:hypothetical protein